MRPPVSEQTVLLYSQVLSSTRMFHIVFFNIVPSLHFTAKSALICDSRLASSVVVVCVLLNLHVHVASRSIT